MKSKNVAVEILRVCEGRKQLGSMKLITLPVEYWQKITFSD